MRGRRICFFIDLPRCRCGKWQTYVGAYDRDGYTVRCHGCLRAIWRCHC